MTIEQRPRLKRRGIYLLPNLLTTLAFFFGFYAIVAALKAHFEIAAIAIFIAMVFDTLDGRIARLTNTDSPFGAEYDSLSDMVTFGIAPALLMYSWSLKSLGKVGWLAVFLYAVATALRLARFNTQVGRVSKRYFQGLPCPIAAGVMASMVWAGTTVFSVQHPNMFVNIVTAIIAVCLAVLMVSNVPYYSFKELDLKGRVPFTMILIFVVICVAVAIKPPPVLFIAFALFVLSGPLTYLGAFRRWKKKRGKRYKLESVQKLEGDSVDSE